MTVVHKNSEIAHSLKLRDGRLLELSSPKVMGILNITPDSFYDGGKLENEEAIVAQAGRMLEEGASILDVGGQSTRPGAEQVPLEEEIQRVVTSIKAILQEFPQAIISVDTFQSGVVLEAVKAGASIVNDISGGQLDAKMFETVASLKVPYILMHTRGTPQTMKSLTNYDNLVLDLLDYFQARLMELQDLGVNDVVIDLGFGFAKTLDQNYELLGKLSQFHVLGSPILTGVSRKSMIYKLLDSSPQEALNGTTALHILALQQGSRILRVHDVNEAVEAVKIWEKFKSPNTSQPL